MFQTLGHKIRQRYDKIPRIEFDILNRPTDINKWLKVSDSVIDGE